MRLVITEKGASQREMKIVLKESRSSHALSNIAVYDA
jgi:hypothetical protein